MIRRATKEDRTRAVQVLGASFDANPAVNDTIIPDGKRNQRLNALMEYIFDTGFARDGVFVMDDISGVVVLYDPVTYPSKFSDSFRQVKLVHRSIGWSRMRYAAAKDKKMAGFRPSTPHLYLQMIGIDPQSQGQGIGSTLINFIQEKSQEEHMPVYLETSVLKNVEMYLRKGFVIHGDWKIRDNYHVHFMHWNP